MKKRNIIFGLLPIFAGVTVAGTGFSAWYFESSEGTMKKEVGVEIAGIHNFSSGGFSYTSPDKLNLDDPTYGAGLKFTGTNANALTLKFKPQDVFGVTSGTYHFTVTATLPSAITTYVEFNTVFSGNFSGVTGATYSNTVSSVSGTGDKSVTFSASGVSFNDDTEQVFTLTLQNSTAAVASSDISNLLHYTSEVIDTTTGKRKSDFTKETYEAMKTAVGSNNNFVFEVTSYGLDA